VVFAIIVQHLLALSQQAMVDHYSNERSFAWNHVDVIDCSNHFQTALIFCGLKAEYHIDQ
jgi:hypothetical protein